MILKAAVLQKESRIVYTGHRHNDCFIAMRDVGVHYFGCIQGFVDAEGNLGKVDIVEISPSANITPTSVKQTDVGNCITKS